MSIYQQINYLIAERRIFEVTPAMGSPALRRMLVGPDVHDLLVGPWPNRDWELRCGALQADLEVFIEGQLVQVAARPYRGKTSYMLRLAPEREEVWEIRSRDPNPGIRVLGRFADINVFIALCWAKRVDLKGPKSREWRDARIECKTQWNNLFGPYKPKSGAYLHDYISSNAVHV